MGRMDPIADVAIPAVIFIMMIVVGHGLTLTELRRSMTDYRAVVAATIGQLVLLPLIATVIVLVLEPSPTIVAGLILVAASPGGTISNFYACLTHANSALSVTLTAVSCLLSFLTVPALVTAGFFFWLDNQPEIVIPPAELSLQLLVLVVLPIAIGMTLRRWRPTRVESRDLLLRRSSLGVVVGLVSFIVWNQRVSMVANLGPLVLVAVVFTVLSMATGYGLAWITGRPQADRLTYLIEFSCRNLALVVVVAVTALGRPELVSFAAVLLLVQAVVMLSMIAFRRRDRRLA
jgi:BASS family bile acid:Na+ symporter